jgi:hypothetical protein
MDGAENERERLEYLTFTLQNRAQTKRTEPAVFGRKSLIPSRPQDIYGVTKFSALHTQVPTSVRAIELSMRSGSLVLSI